jgi:hypothetical protein
MLASNTDAELREALAVIDSSVYLLRRRCVADPNVVRHLDRISAHLRRAFALARLLSGENG